MKTLLLGMAAAMVWAQAPVAFEAASIKPNTSGDPGLYQQGSATQISLRNNSLRDLVQKAYRLHDYDYSAPAWLGSVRFDVVAKYPQGASFGQFPEMLQALLAERFQLAVHRETKQLDGLNLVVDKKGLRIQPVDNPQHGTSGGPSMVQGIGVTMTEFANLLAKAVNRPVKDATNLTGFYTMKVAWMPESGPAPKDAENLPPSVYVAVQELGLKLEVQKVSVDVLVVDHAERTPSGN